MFDKLRKAFSTAAKSIGQKEITERVLNDTLLDLQISLLESDVAQEVVDNLSSNLKSELLGLKLEKDQDVEQIIKSKFRDAVAIIFARGGKLDILQKISSKKAEKNGPFTIVFLGINGTGKTTTVAKFANLLRKSGFSAVIAAGDTHRSGAIEQLTKHAENLSIKVIAQRYGADPSAVGRDAVDYARKHYVDVVLVDTAGRMQTSKNLMDEMSKIVRVVKPDMKLFIGDALAGNDTINQAKEFFHYTNFDGAILSKIDADAKGGAAISIAHITAKPILYVGVGQGYDDLVAFNPDGFMDTLFGTASTTSFESLIPQLAQTPSAQGSVKPSAPVNEPDLSPLEKLRKEPPEEEPLLEQPKLVNVEFETKIPESRDRSLEEPKEQKKSRFGFFGKKSKGKAKKKEEEPLEHESPEEAPIEDVAEKKSKEDKDKGEQEDKVIYLTDEDIEDLLK